MTPLHQPPLRHSLMLALMMGTALLVALPPTASYAEEEPLNLGTVTITARKRPEALKDVPMAIHVETGERLAEKGVIDGLSLIGEVEGLTLGTFGDRSNAFGVIRGVGPILSSLSPDDSSVLTFVDGAPLSIGASTAAFLDLDRVEVLKGPQNTLFGRNTTGGAILLVPNAPEMADGGAVRLEYGTEGTHLVEGIWNKVLVPDVLAARFALRRSGRDGYIPNLAGPDLGGDGTLSGRASILWTPDALTRWQFTIAGEDSASKPITYILNRPDGVMLAAQNLNVDDTKMFSVNSELSHDFGAATLTWQSSFSRYRNTNTYNVPDFLLAAEAFGMSPGDFSDPATNFMSWDKDERRETHELRFTSSPEADLKWTAGLVWYRDTALRDKWANMWLYAPVVSGGTTYDLETTGRAAFGEVELPLAAATRLSLGARATRERKIFSGAYFTDGTPGTVAEFHESGRQDYSFLTGRAALSHDWSEELTSWISLSRGYKSGGFGLNNDLIWAGIPREPYESARVSSVEIGSRAILLGGDLEIGGSVFLNEVKNEQILSWDFTSFSSQNLNVDTRTHGLELEGRWQVSGSWALDGGLAWTRSRLTRVSAEAATAQPGLLVGNQLPTVPEFTLRLAAEFRGSGADLGLGGGLADREISLRIAYAHTGERFTDASNYGRLEAVHDISLRAGMQLGQGEAYVFVTNLLDRQHKILNDSFGLNPAGDRVFGAAYAPGRVIGIGYRMNF